MSDVKEVDQDSPPNDHLGDYRAGHGDPYPATQDAWAKSTVDLPANTHANPAEVRGDFNRAAESAYYRALPVREAAAAEWFPRGLVLVDGVNAVQLAGADPQRVRLTITNDSTGPVFLAPTTTRLIGDGSFMLKSGRSVELRTTAEVFLWTQSTFVAGAEPVQVQVIAERLS